jgi:uncharacterized membrane protein YebE (DUF533 family)
MQQHINSVRSFLDKMLSVGPAPVGTTESVPISQLREGGAPAERDPLRQMLIASGAVAGVLTMLLGSRKMRKVAGTAGLAGGLGFLGKVAFDAFTAAPGGNQRLDNARERPVHLLPDADADAERRALTLTHAIISAAKADGHIDAAEERAIEAQLEWVPDLVRAQLASALLRPANAEAIAAMATSDQERREIYAASVLACGKDHPDEVNYLATLARALKLPAAQVVAIEAGILAGD